MAARMNFSQSTVFSIIASFGLLFINLFINIIEARVLGPTEIGRYQVYITTQTLVATICALGIGQACIYYINALKVDEREVLASSIKFTSVLALLAGILLFVVILLNRDYFGYEPVICVALFCIGTSTMMINNIFTPVLLTKMEVVRNQIAKYSTRVLTLMALLIVLFSEYQLSVGLIIALGGIIGIFALLLLYFYFHDRFSFRDKINYPLLWKIILWGVKLSGNNIASITLTSIPIYFLTWFSTGNGVLDVGYYSRANSLLVVGTVIASSIGPLLYSKWSGSSDDELISQVKRLSMLYIIVNFFIAVSLVVMAPLLIRILYGTEYNPAISILQVLSFTLLGNGVKEICYGVLSSRGKPLKILKNLTIGILISVVLNYFAIHYFGVIGCACVTVLATIATALLLMNDVTKVSIVSFADFFVIPTKQNIKTIIKSIFHKV